MVNIKEVLDELRIPYKSHGESPLVSEGWIGVVCPWCDTGQNNPGLGIPLNGRVASCWKCGTHNIGAALVKLSGLPYHKIKPWVDGLDRPYLDELRKHGGTLELPRGIVKMMGVHRQYLRDRGFKPSSRIDEIERLWDVQGIDLAGGQYAWSLFVPIKKYGRTVSWLTRKINEHGKRYSAAPAEMEEIPAKRCLYGMDLIRNACVVVEGVTKVWAGGPGFCATLGTGWTQAQLAELSKVPVRAILFDRGEEAQARARELARALEPFPGSTYVVELDSGPQLDEADPEEVREVRQKFLGV